MFDRLLIRADCLLSFDEPASLQDFLRWPALRLRVSGVQFITSYG